MSAEIAVMGGTDGPLASRSQYNGHGRPPTAATGTGNMMAVALYLQDHPRQRVTAKLIAADTGIVESSAARHLSRFARERSDVETHPAHDRDGPLPRGTYTYTPGKGPGDLRGKPPASPPELAPAAGTLEVVGTAGEGRLVVRMPDGECKLLVDIP
jgi:hypothetical protein